MLNFHINIGEFIVALCTNNIYSLPVIKVVFFYSLIQFYRIMDFSERIIYYVGLFYGNLNYPLCLPSKIELICLLFTGLQFYNMN